MFLLYQFIQNCQYIVVLILFFGYFVCFLPYFLFILPIQIILSKIHSFFFNQKISFYNYLKDIKTNGKQRIYVTFKDLIQRINVIEHYTDYAIRIVIYITKEQKRTAYAQTNIF